MTLEEKIKRARTTGKVRENFLPIPDAPNYEINSQLIMRNRKTKQILSLCSDYKKFKHYSLHVSWRSGTVKRSPKTFRSQAVAAAKEETFEPIPSTGGRYEINKQGIVRNSSTKHILKPTGRGGKVCPLSIGERKYSPRCIADLLWEVFGIIPKRRFSPQPCSIENTQGKIFFPSLCACARFLAQKMYYAVHTVENWLNARRERIADWKISYPPREVYEVDWNVTSLAALAKRQAKLDKEVGL